MHESIIGAEQADKSAKKMNGIFAGSESGCAKK
jgi:hypothetical protein